MLHQLRNRLVSWASPKGFKAWLATCWRRPVDQHPCYTLRHLVPAPSGPSAKLIKKERKRKENIRKARCFMVCAVVDICWGSFLDAQDGCLHGARCRRASQNLRLQVAHAVRGSKFPSLSMIREFFTEGDAGDPSGRRHQPFGGGADLCTLPRFF